MHWLDRWKPDRWKPELNAAFCVRLIALIYFIAFTSWGVQASGLIGSHGILPAAQFLQAAHEQYGNSAYWFAPSLFWLNPGDASLTAGWVFGALFALVAIFAPWKWAMRIALAACLILWVSLCSVGQDFLSFQWDVLLSEAGFLAIFADDTPVRIWLFRWLAFRLMFYSGVVKLTSGDPNWRNLTAMRYHYETQPLPAPLAWYMAQLPLWFQKGSTAFTFVAELAAPFSFFGPRKARHIGAWIVLALQALIIATGNYTYFNLLAIAITLFLFIEPGKQPRTRGHRAVSAMLAGFIAMVSACLTFQLFSAASPGMQVILRWTEPLRIVNTYGLFAVMTTERQEIVVEGSNDGDIWLAYEFPYKPGDLRRAPPLVAPHQPRLDWQMWFAALSNYRQNRWFVGFMLRVLQGEPAVLRLLSYNPFPKAPPKFIRARLYLYHFTHFGQAGWWTREDRGEYFPAVGLK
jgi:hypothetical protein